MKTWKSQTILGILYPEYYDFSNFLPLDINIQNVPLACVCFGTNKYNPHKQVDISRTRGRNDYQLLFVVSGQMKVVLDGKTYMVERNSLIFYPPGVPQNYQVCGEDHISYFIHFGGSKVEEYLKKHPIPSNIFTFKEDFHFFNDTIKRMYIGKNFKHNKAYCNTLLLELLITISSKSDITATGEGFSKLLLAMKENCQNNLPIKYYADFFGYNEEYFIRFFKKAMHITPYKYLISLKLEKSCDLLINTDYSISEIALKTGYSDVNSFSKAFKISYNTTPSEYRFSKRTNKE